MTIKLNDDQVRSAVAGLEYDVLGEECIGIGMEILEVEDAPELRDEEGFPSFHLDRLVEAAALKAFSEICEGTRVVAGVNPARIGAAFAASEAKKLARRTKYSV